MPYGLVMLQPPFQLSDCFARDTIPCLQCNSFNLRMSMSLVYTEVVDVSASLPNPGPEMPFPPAVQHFSNKTRPSTLVNFVVIESIVKESSNVMALAGCRGDVFKTRLHDLIIERVRRYNIRNNTKLVSPFNELFSACISYVRLLPVPSTLVAAELATVPVLSSNYRIRFTAVFWHGRQKWFQLRSYMF